MSGVTDIIRRGGALRSRRPVLAAAIAATLLLQGCRNGPEQADRYEALYDRLVSVKAYPAALKAIRTATQKDEDQPRRWLKLGEVLLALNRPSEAVSAFQRALDLQPDNLEALQTLAVLSVRANEFELAKKYIDPLLLIQPNNIGGLIASGAIALRERRFDDAIKIGDTLTSNYPDRTDGPIVKARALDLKGDTRAAIAELAPRVEKVADNADILQQLMQFYQKIGDRAGIQATAIKLRTLFPDDARYAFESARAYHAQGRPDLEKGAIDAIRQKFGGNPSAMVALAQFWRETEPSSVAHDNILKLAAASGPAVKLALGQTLIGMGDAAGAADVLAPLAPPTVTTGNVDAQARYARALLVAGRNAEAKAKDDAVLAFDPSHPEGLILRARLELAAKRYADALTDAQLVVRDDDRNEEAALLIAQIYAAQGNDVLAAGAFGSARNDFPDSAAAVRAEAQWLLSKQRYAEAIDRASSFAQSHTRRADSWALYQDVCRATPDAAGCLGQMRKLQAMS